MGLVALFMFVIGITLFIIAGAVAVPEPWHNRRVCYGLACFAGAELITKWPGLLH